MLPRTKPRARFARRPGSLPAGPIPYGYKRGSGGHLVEDTDTYPVVEHIKYWSREGSSPEAIAEGLNADGIPSPRGRQWNHITVWRIAKRAAP